MTNLDELNLQNHKLTELSNVLVYLLQERTMCDTETTCNLLFNFLEQINDHIRHVDRLYQGLLTDNDPKANKTAQMFMSGELELTRIITQYTKKWCKKDRRELWVADHVQFSKDTRELFEIVLSRIQKETEHLYPLVRETQVALA